MALKNADDTVKFAKKFYNAIFNEAMTSLAMIMIPLSEFLFTDLRWTFIALTLFFALRSAIVRFLSDWDDRRIKADLATTISNAKLKAKDLEVMKSIKLAELNIEKKRIELEGDIFNLKKDVVKQQEQLRGNIILTRLKNIEKRNQHLIRSGAPPDLLEELDDEVDFLTTEGLTAPFEDFAIDKIMSQTIPQSIKAVDKKFVDINIGVDNDVKEN